MAKQTINVGATANDKKGDSLRAAFTKVNANFTELYTALGLNTDGTLNLGAFEFSGSTMTTTDSTPIVIDQSVTVSSDLTVGGDIVPSVANGGNLGSLSKPFKSLYVSNATVYFGGVPLSLDAGTNELKVNNVPISQTITYADIPNVPTDVADLTDTTGLLSGGANTGDITFTNSIISAGNNDEVIVQAQDASSFATARLNLEPEYSTAKLSAFSGESVDTFTAGVDFTSGVWQDNGFGNGVVSFIGAQSIGDLFQNTIFSLNPANVTIQINSEPAFTWNGGASGGGTSTPGFGTNPIVPASPIAITSITFTYRRESYISVSYDNQEIRLDAQNAGIRMDANNTIQIYGDNEIDLQAATTFRIAAEEDINIGTGSAYAVRVSGGDFVVNASDDIDIRGSDSFRLRNDSPTAPIRIITDDDNAEHTWAFNPNGSITFPDATVQTTAYTGSVEADTLDSVTDRNAVTTNNITVGAVITTDINNKLSAPTGNIVTNVRHWESAGASLYIWFDAASKPDVKAIGDFGDITGWTVSVSDGNSATVTATNPAGYFSISTSVALTGTGTLTFTSPDYVAPQPLPIDINVGANTWRFDNTSNLILPETVSTVGPKISTTTISNGGTDYQGVIITPDPDYNSGYGLKIYPGGPVDPEANHLHLTATDPATVDLFLGDDDHYVKVASDGMVEISGNTVRLWGEGIFSNSYFNLPNNNDSASSPATLANYGAAGVQIQAGQGDPVTGQTPTWNFGADGRLLLGSDLGVIYADQTTGIVRIGDYIGPGGAPAMPSTSISIGGPDNAFMISRGQSMSPGGINPVWYFDKNGHTTIPGDIKSNGNINIEINLADSTLRRWQFGEDGDLTLPTDGTVQVNDGNLNLLAENYVFIESTGNGQINIGNDNPNGTSIVLGNKTFGGIVGAYGDLLINAGVLERFESLADATGIVEHNCRLGHIFYHTSPDANWTANITNLDMFATYATTITIIISQGGTGYYPNALQIDGAAQTINWQGNTTPTVSTNRIDVVTFSILRAAGGAYTVLGQITGF